MDAFSRFDIRIKHIDHGSFGFVETRKDSTTNEIVACKIIRFREDRISREDTDLELKILSSLKHRYIVKYIDHGWEPEQALIFMEFCSRGNLHNLIEKQGEIAVEEKIVWQLVGQMASALAYCHYGVYKPMNDGVSTPDSQWDPVLHRDIKPSNILLCPGKGKEFDFKLGDFGLSKLLNEDEPPSSYVGTIQFRPPEISKSRSSPIEWSKKSDIFSLGCCFYVLCTLKTYPFNPDSGMKDETDKLLRVSSKYSHTLAKCIETCTSFQPERRHDAFDILRVIGRLRNSPHTVTLVPELLPVPDAEAPRDSAQSLEEHLREPAPLISSLELYRVVERHISSFHIVRPDDPRGVIYICKDSLCREIVHHTRAAAIDHLNVKHRDAGIYSGYIISLMLNEYTEANRAEDALRMRRWGRTFLRTRVHQRATISFFCPIRLCERLRCAQTEPEAVMRHIRMSHPELLAQAERQVEPERMEMSLDRRGNSRLRGSPSPRLGPL